MVQSTMEVAGRCWAGGGGGGAHGHVLAAVVLGTGSDRGREQQQAFSVTRLVPEGFVVSQYECKKHCRSRSCSQQWFESVTRMKTNDVKPGNPKLKSELQNASCVVRIN